MVFLTVKGMELHPQSHTYLESVSPEERQKNIYMATPLKNFFFQKKDGATDLKLWHTDTT